MKDLFSKKEIFRIFATQQQAKDPTEDLEGLAKLCLEFGRSLSLSASDLAVLEAGAYLHDIGNLLLPDDILRYPGKLNIVQWSIVKQHPILGVKLLEDSASLKEVLPIVELHHERIDGSGYPHGLVGDNIPFLVQVFAICDVWHSATSSKPYRDRLSHSQAIAELETEADFGHHNTVLVGKFFQFLEAINRLINAPDNQSIIALLDSRSPGS